jgi:putative membrane protein
VKDKTVSHSVPPETAQHSESAPVNALRGILKSRAGYAGLVAGVGLFAAVIAWQGIGDVASALAQAGWGVVAIVLLHLPPLWADSMGWRSLFPAGQRPRWRMMIKARWIGESINDLLPVLQMGGNVVKAWLLVNCGIPVDRAGASVVVDVTLVVLTQILFTVLGIGISASLLGGRGSLVAVFTGTGIMAILLAAFYVAQRKGFFSIIVRVTRRILGGTESTTFSEGAATIDGEVLRLYRNRRALVAAGFWHILSWFLGIGEVWLALRLLGHPVDFGTALLFESLGQAIRTGAFAVPGALGIQEGGYILIGGALGIQPHIALALSLARRVRELLLGLPGLAVWQASTVQRIFMRGLNNEVVPPSGPEGSQ